MSTGLRTPNVPLKVGARFSRKALPMALLLIGMLAVQGCEPPQSPGRGIGASGAPGTRNVSKPSFNKPAGASIAQQPVNTPKVDLGANVATKAEPSKVLGSLDAVEVAGNKIELASLIIAANTNPFLNRLPKPLVAEAPTTPDAPEAPPVDPFENLNLLGIIYNPKQPMALVSEGDGPTSIKKAGDLLSNGSIRIVRIGQEDILLEQVGGVSKQQRSLALPNIVGYASKDKNNADGDPKAPADSAKSRFKNISKLSDLESELQKDGTDVKLEEP